MNEIEIRPLSEASTRMVDGKVQYSRAITYGAGVMLLFWSEVEDLPDVIEHETHHDILLRHEYPFDACHALDNIFPDLKSWRAVKNGDGGPERCIKVPASGVIRWQVSK